MSQVYLVDAVSNPFTPLKKGQTVKVLIVFVVSVKVVKEIVECPTAPEAKLRSEYVLLGDF